MAANDWCPRFPTLGGTPMQSRLHGRVAATDHCVAIVRRCQTCYNAFVAERDESTGRAETVCKECR